MLHSSILLRLQAAIITLSPSILVDELFWLTLELKGTQLNIFAYNLENYTSAF